MLSPKHISPGEDGAGPKKHAACDECRARKLKCSGEQSGCRRCVKQGLSCHYSVQKQMGRPPKKRKTEADTPEKSNSSPIDIISEVEKGWSPDDISSAEAAYLTPPPHVYMGDIASSQTISPAGLMEPTTRMTPIAATADPWPDFATTSASASMLSIGTGYSDTSLDMTTGAPQCPCLSYLYLCLSTISSLNSFSINRETINSLCTAARTARSVIRCEICPLSFATGVQNVMMLGTLLSVMADAWFRIARADAGTLGRELTSPEFQQLLIEKQQDTRAAWRFWLRQVLRRAIIGVPIHAKLCQPTVACNKTPDLLSLIREMEARQHKWHSERGCADPSAMPFSTTNSTRTSSYTSSDDMSTSPDSSPKSSSNLSSVEDLSPEDVAKQHDHDVVERDFLCLKILAAAKQGVARFAFHPSEYPRGVQPL